MSHFDHDLFAGQDLWAAALGRSVGPSTNVDRACLGRAQKKPVVSLERLPTGYVSRSDLSAAKWSRWEKRESLSVLLHKPLCDFGEPCK